MTLFHDADNWRAGMQDVAEAIDQTFGELVTVTPVRPGEPNFPGVPEPEKAVTVTASFSSRAKSVSLAGGRQFSGRVNSPLVSTSEPYFTFRRGALPFHMQQNYRITRCCGGEIFEVIDVASDGVSSVACRVVQLGRQKESR